MIGLIVGSVRGLVLERGKMKMIKRALDKERDHHLDDLRQQGSERRKQEFEIMREIEEKVEKVQRYSALGVSFFAYVLIWLIGALVFWFTEQRPQHLTYFEALYFAYTTLLTIGYGDFYPQSNSGKPFFVVWSLIAIPTVTVLISNLGKTLIEWLKVGTLWVGQRTILPERNNNGVKSERSKQKNNSSEREQGLEKDVEKLGQAVEHAEEERGQPSSRAAILAREIANAVKDLGNSPPRKYDWDEWQRFLQLMGIQKDASSNDSSNQRPEKDEVDWTLLGDDGPLFSPVNEPEWVLGRLCMQLEKEFEHK